MKSTRSKQGAAPARALAAPAGALAAPAGALTARQLTDEIARRLKSAARKLSVTYCEGLRPVSATERKALATRLEACLGGTLSAEMQHRLSFPRHVKLHWEYEAADAAPLINGEISLHNVGIAVLEKDFSYVDYGANPHLTFLDTYRILEDKPYGGDGNMTIVSLNDAFTDVELHYTEMFRPPHRIRLSYEEYLRCELVTLGYSHWQFLFCEGLNPQMSEHMHGPYKQKLVHDLHMLWPDLDLGELLALAERAAPAPAPAPARKPARKPAARRPSTRTARASAGQSSPKRGPRRG